MRPFVHPDLDTVPVEAILHALADPVRVAIYADIVAQDCSQSCSSFQHVLAQPIPKSTLSQHFKVLREAGLVRAERRGVEMHNVSRCAEVEARYPGLISSIVAAHNAQLAAAKRAKKAAKTKGFRRKAGN